MFDLTLLGALIAGFLSFASPCVLPIVPFYLSYIAGVGLSDLKSAENTKFQIRRKSFIRALFFSLGMILVFVGLGASATAFGSIMREWFVLLKSIASVVIVLMGLHFLGIFKIIFLNRHFTLNIGSTDKSSNGVSFLLGLAFAFGWTPCVGPVLAMILFTAASTGSLYQGILLLVSYGAGMTVPFIVASIFIGPFLQWSFSFRKHLGKVEKVTGGALVIFGCLIASNTVDDIAGWMLDLGPDFWTFG